MRKTDLKDLEETLERLRIQLHPELDADFLQSVLQAEKDNPEDDQEGMQAIETALQKALAAKGVV